MTATAARSTRRSMDRPCSVNRASWAEKVYGRSRPGPVELQFTQAESQRFEVPKLDDVAAHAHRHTRGVVVERDPLHLTCARMHDANGCTSAGCIDQTHACCFAAV